MNIIHTNFQYKECLIPLNLSKVLFILLHHVDAVTATPEEIHQWHLDNGWAGFGYNEYIRKDGTVYIGRGYNIGAQCQNLNSKSYGIALEGNYDVETSIPDAQLKALLERLEELKKVFPNLQEIARHDKFFPTSCPGKNVDINSIIERLNNAPLASDIDVLKEHDIINSPDYWLNNAQKDKTCKGEYVATLIKNIANKLKGE